MTTAMLTTKGRITVPVDIRRALELQTGDRVAFVQVGSGRFELVFATRSVRELKGMLGQVMPSVSIVEMKQSTAARRSRAGRNKR